MIPDARFRDLTTDLSGNRTEPDVFFPFAQRTDRDIQIAVRTSDGALVPIRVLQQAVSEIDAGLPLYQVSSLMDPLRQQTSTSRFASALLTLFSAGALMLAGIGLYGLVAYVVGMSRQEIAIRMALGASAAGVTALIVPNGMALVVSGIVVGILGALGAARALQGQLFQTSATDPGAFALVALMLLLVTFIASLLPTRRAVAVEPHAALASPLTGAAEAAPSLRLLWPRHLRIRHRRVIGERGKDDGRLLQILLLHPLERIHVGVMRAHVVIDIVLDGIEARKADRREAQMVGVADVVDDVPCARRDP